MEKVDGGVVFRGRQVEECNEGGRMENEGLRVKYGVGAGRVGKWV